MYFLFICFRYNLLTEETEFRPSGQREIPFCRIDKRELNTFCLEAQKEGINCWDKDLQRYIYSTQVESYHPFRLYMDELPAWDGTDRLKSLAKRVSDAPIWIKSFHIWMLLRYNMKYGVCKYLTKKMFIFS